MLQSKRTQQTPGPHEPAPPCLIGMGEAGPQGHRDPILSKQFATVATKNPLLTGGNVRQTQALGWAAVMPRQCRGYRKRESKRQAERERDTGKNK